MEEKTYYLNFDGSAMPNPGQGGAAAIITDTQRKLVVEKGIYLGHTTNNMAEYRGLLLGLDLLLQLGATNVAIMGDSKLVVNQIGGNWKVKEPSLRPLHSKAMEVLSMFKKWSIRWVPRGENSETDRLAKSAIKYKCMQ